MLVCFSIASLGRIGKFSKKSTSKNAFKEKMKILKTIIKKLTSAFVIVDKSRQEDEKLFSPLFPTFISVN